MTPPSEPLDNGKGTERLVPIPEKYFTKVQQFLEKEQRRTRFGSWLRNCLSAHGRWALAVSLLVVLPTWLYLCGREAISEIAEGSLLPFSAEAAAEASDTDSGLERARREHVEMLGLYIRTLDSHDVLSFLNIGKPAALRRKLIEIANDLKSEPDPAKAIKLAANRTYQLYEDFDTPALSFPRFSQKKDGGMLVAVSAFCSTLDLFERTMKTKDASIPRKVDLCELTCLDSRRAFLVIFCLWNRNGEKERREIIDRFAHCESRSVDLTESLAKQLAQSQPAKADTLRSYAKSMKRRLQIIEAMITGDHDQVIRLLKEPQRH